MSDNPPGKMYFFDMPVNDARIVAVRALRMAYHGSVFGSLGGASSRSQPLELQRTCMIRVTFKHVTEQPLSPDYIYHLLYVRKDLASNIWSERLRSKRQELVGMTRRVKLCSTRSIKPNRIKWFAKSENRPVHIAKIPFIATTDNYVPREYVDEFNQRYEGFLVRTKRDYPVVRNLIGVLGLFLHDKRALTGGSSFSLTEVFAYQSVEASVR